MSELKELIARLEKDRPFAVEATQANKGFLEEALRLLERLETGPTLGIDAMDKANEKVVREYVLKINPSIAKKSELATLSLGGGVQSSALALMMVKGEIPKADFAVFADTQWEARRTLDNLAFLKTQLEQASIPLVTATRGSLPASILRAALFGGRDSSPPFFTDHNGFTNRKCTKDYKIFVINRVTRWVLDDPKMKRHKVSQMQGISFDERSRMKAPRHPWATNVYPLVALQLRRSDCIAWLIRNGFAVPPKSSCVGCPYHTKSQWVEQKKQEPEAFADICTIDRAIREPASFCGLKAKPYFHRSLAPVEEIVKDNQLGLFDDHFEECDGVCFT